MYDIGSLPTVGADLLLLCEGKRAIFALRFETLSSSQTIIFPLLHPPRRGKMDPDRVRAYLQVACAGLGFDIGEIWWSSDNNGSSSALMAIGKSLEHRSMGVLGGFLHVFVAARFSSAL